MSAPLFSPSWYRVAQLRPRLRGHTHIHRHQYRGEIWYVLQDRAKGRFYRFTPATYQFIGRMDGKQTVHELWETTTDRLGDDSLTQEHVIRLLGQLHTSDVLLCDVPPDTAELLKRAEQVERTRWLQKLRSPLAIRIPLLDPDRFLSRTLRYVRPVFGVVAALVWGTVVAGAVIAAGLHWPELTENLVDRVLSAQGLLAMALIYPVVKVFHELGHAYAVKRWGGEVHELGVMLLVFMPVPYVDASAASEFRSKRQRMIVGAAGILVELFLAALALFLWIELEPGYLRSAAYNVILIGSVSTLLFNGNPLLRYDGYYVLSDLLEIPNLSQRGTAYLGYLVRRYAFAAKTAEAPQLAPGEGPWFVVYTVAAFVYRIFIYTAIVLFLASKLFVLGILLALWSVVSMVVIPVGKGARFLFTSPVLRDRRPRALLLCGAAAGVLALLLFVLPFPLRTRTEGVVWAPDESLVRSATNGFVERVVAAPGTLVEPGTLLVACRDPLLPANVAVLRARFEEAQSRYAAAAVSDRVQAQMIQEEMGDIRADLARAEERVEELEIRSRSHGLFVLPSAADLPNHYLAQGDLIGFVLDVERPIVRVVVPQPSVDLVRQATREVLVRPAERLDLIVPASIKREVPAAEEHLPSTILGQMGGGAIAIDPTEQGGTKTFEKMFQFDVELDEPLGTVFVGGRVHVRFDHGYEPVGFQILRSIRQLFLKRFNV